MNDISISSICLNSQFATTRLLITEKPAELQVLPLNLKRKGQGGLKTRGYYKTNHPDKPLISIITVVYNGRQHLKETISSVINLDYDNVEYLIIDGGSTDGTIDLIREYDDCIDYWVSEPDSGLYDAMNKGWSIIHPDSAVLFLGAGDKIFSLPADMTDLRNHQVIYGRVQLGPSRIFKSRVNWQLKFANTLHHQALLIPKRLHIASPFDTNYRVYADFDFNLRILKMGTGFRYDRNFLAYAMPGGASEPYSLEAYRIAGKNYGFIFGILAYLFYIYQKNFSGVRHKVEIVGTNISAALTAQIFFEALFYPFLRLFWAGWNRYSRYLPLPKIKRSDRKTDEDEKVFICLHDWLGYPAERSKTLKNGITFSCGRAKILREIAECKNKIPYEIIVSLSGTGEYDFDARQIKKVLRVKNRGQDFRGYSTMLHEILKAPGNPFIVLMNSSVSGGFYDGWLDDYCSIVKKDRSLGLLGISTRASFPGLLKNHFTPHLQSFFLISTQEVLSLILKNNNGMLPGSKERNKYRLIQKGEIGLSLQILKLGFTFASVYGGNVRRFRLQNRFSSNISQWPFPLEDIRLTSTDQQPPNSLHKIEQKN